MEAAKGSVVLEWTQGFPPRSFVFYVEDMLIDILRPQPEVGALDGNEVGSGGFRIFLYGTDAERLWRAIEPTVLKLEPRPVAVTITANAPGTDAREIRFAD